MKPIQFAGADELPYSKPIGWNAETEGDCHDLYVKRGSGQQITSVWQPTVEERVRIAEGQNITLTCVGVQPPVLVGVASLYAKGDGPREVIDDTLYQRKIREAADVKPLSVAQADGIDCNCEKCLTFWSNFGGRKFKDGGIVGARQTNARLVRWVIVCMGLLLAACSGILLSFL